MFLGAWGCSLASLSAAAETSRDALERDAASAACLRWLPALATPCLAPRCSSSRSCTRAGPCSMVHARGEGGVVRAAAGSVGAKLQGNRRLRGCAVLPRDLQRAPLAPSSPRGCAWGASLGDIRTLCRGGGVSEVPMLVSRCRSSCFSRGADADESSGYGSYVAGMCQISRAF